VPRGLAHIMTTSPCVCVGDDCAAAKDAVRKAGRIVELVDESHFMAAIRQCAHCGQPFLTLFCERVDWANGDDPQTWIAVPVDEGEAQQLRGAAVAANENVMLDIIAGERRFLYHDMPKGAPDRLEWRRGRLFIPPHD